MSRRAFLREDALFEPLFNQWFALFPLIPPATAAISVVQSHLRILKSFVDSPRLHANALRDRRFAGSPFAAIPAERAPEVRALLDRTVKENLALIDFVKGVWKLDALLDAEAKGNSLEPLYPRIPDALKGKVELTYNLRHSPQARFIEGLLYRSPVYREAAQTVSLSLASEDTRPFVMSTPRLEDEGSLHLPLRFRDPALDALFRARAQAVDPLALAEQLGVPAAKRERFERLFTDTPPPAAAPYRGEGLRARFFGHACVLLESAEGNVLIDPLIGLRFPGALERYSYADLPERIDTVLITHIHADHVVLESLLQLRHKVGQVIVPKSSGDGRVDPSVRWALTQVGFPRVRELDELETVEIPGGSVTGAPFLGEHCDLDIRSKLAHFIRLGEVTVLAATDSNALEPAVYDGVAESLGALDLLLLGTECEGAPISYGYGNLFSTPVPRELDVTRRQSGSNAASAIEIVRRLQPRFVQNYAMGLEPWLKHLFPVYYTDTSPQIVESNKFLAHCAQVGIPAARPFAKAELHVAPRGRRAVASAG